MTSLASSCDSQCPRFSRTCASRSIRLTGWVIKNKLVNTKTIFIIRSQKGQQVWCGDYDDHDHHNPHDYRLIMIAISS